MARNVSCMFYSVFNDNGKNVFKCYFYFYFTANKWNYPPQKFQWELHTDAFSMKY